MPPEGLLCQLQTPLDLGDVQEELSRNVKCVCLKSTTEPSDEDQFFSRPPEPEGVTRPFGWAGSEFK